MTVCLDGVSGALAGAAVATLAIAPVLTGFDGRSWAHAVVVAFPLLDAVLVAAALGALALVSVQHGRQFGLWALGLLVLTVAHTLQGHRLAVGDAGGVGAVMRRRRDGAPRGPGSRPARGGRPRSRRDDAEPGAGPPLARGARGRLGRVACSCSPPPRRGRCPRPRRPWPWAR